MTERDAQLGANWIETSVGVRLRPDLCVIDVDGEDQRTWLNGQISNDVRQTRAGEAVYALVLNIRGKILSDLWALDRGDGFSLVVPVATRDTLRDHLEQYIIMEDVVLTPRDAAVVSVQGPRSAELVSFASQPFACDELGIGGYYLIAPQSEGETLLSELGTRAAEFGGGIVDNAAFEIARLRHKIPRFGQDFDIHHYPQEAGLKQRAVSFSKGCYLGQEVVCTLESRGKLSRKLVAFCYDGQAPSVGGTIFSANGDESGAVTSVSGDHATGHALGYVRRVHIDPASTFRAGTSTTLTIEHVVGED